MAQRKTTPAPTQKHNFIIEMVKEHNTLPKRRQASQSVEEKAQMKKQRNNSSESVHQQAVSLLPTQVTAASSSSSLPSVSAVGSKQALSWTSLLIDVLKEYKSTKKHFKDLRQDNESDLAEWADLITVENKKSTLRSAFPDIFYNEKRWISNQQQEDFLNNCINALDTTQKAQMGSFVFETSFPSLLTFFEFVYIQSIYHQMNNFIHC